MNTFYQLKITLKDIEPVIWRRFTVPSHITLDRLHDVVQIVMGWQDSHLHQLFSKNKFSMNIPKRSAITMNPRFA